MKKKTGVVKSGRSVMGGKSKVATVRGGRGTVLNSGQIYADMSKLSNSHWATLEALLHHNAKDKDVKKLSTILKAKKIDKAHFEKIGLFVEEVLASIEADLQMISSIRKDVQGLKSNLKTVRI